MKRDYAKESKAFFIGRLKRSTLGFKNNGNDINIQTGKIEVRNRFEELIEVIRFRSRKSRNVDIKRAMKIEGACWINVKFD